MKIYQLLVKQSVGLKIGVCVETFENLLETKAMAAACISVDKGLSTLTSNFKA